MPSCPLCGQPMDFYAITYRNHPFIDGQTYPAMCFGCAHVPKEYVQIYDKDDNVEEEQGPYFDYKHLQTPQELHEAGSCETLLEAKRCVWAVKNRLKEVGTVALKKLKLKRPQQEYDFWEGGDEDEKPAPRKKRVVRKKPSTVKENSTVKKKRATKKKFVKKSTRRKKAANKLPPPKWKPMSEE